MRRPKKTGGTPFIWERVGAARAQTIFGGTGGGQVVTPETAMASTTVRACVQKIAHTVASLDVDMFQVDGVQNKPKLSTPLSDILKVQPVVGMTAFDLLGTPHFGRVFVRQRVRNY